MPKNLAQKTTASILCGVVSSVILFAGSISLGQNQAYIVNDPVPQGPLVPVVANGSSFDLVNFQSSKQAVQQRTDSGSMNISSSPLQPIGELLTAKGSKPQVSEALLADDEPDPYGIPSQPEELINQRAQDIAAPNVVSPTAKYLTNEIYNPEFAQPALQPLTNSTLATDQMPMSNQVGEPYFEANPVQPAIQTGRSKLGSRIFSRSSMGKSISFFGGWTYPLYASNGPPYYFRPAQRNEEGGAFVVNFGRRISSRLRTGLEIGYQRSEFSQGGFYAYSDYAISPYEPFGSGQGELKTYSGMFNLYLDFDRMPNRFITPYAGAGIGMAFFDGELEPYYGEKREASDSTFAFQAIAGLATKLTSRLDYLLEYRYFTTSQEDYCDELYGYSTGNCRLERSNFFMGIRYRY